MAKVFRPSTRESSILSRIESSKEYARRKALGGIRDCAEALANSVSMKLVESQLVETTNKNELESQLLSALENLSRADDFDIDYLCAPFRQVVTNPHVVSLYLTAFLIEKMINHKCVVDIFGSDEEIYHCINKQVAKHLS